MKRRCLSLQSQLQVKPMTTPKLTDEMRQALAARPGGPIPIADDQSPNFYILLTKDDYCRLHDDYVRKELQIAFDQVDRGDVGELDMDALLTEAHRRYAARQRESV
jgi:hypothetical protein